MLHVRQLGVDFDSTATTTVKVNGLRNRGNSCFLNAVLQSLASSKLFREYLDGVNESGKREDMPLTTALQNTFTKLTGNQTGAFDPDVAEVDSVKKRFMKNREQHDSHELMQFLINQLIEESSNSIKKGMGLASALLQNGKPKKELPFTGILKNIMQCQGCERLSAPTYQQFVDLSLSIPESKGPISLEDCLKYFTTSERLFDLDCTDWKPPGKAGLFDDYIKENKKCHHATALKKLTIAKAPKTLCLHIRRLVATEHGFMKVNRSISFPFTLDLSPYCTFDCDTSAESFDKTFSKISHKSTPSTSSLFSPAKQVSGLFGNFNLQSCIGGDSSHVPRGGIELDYSSVDHDNPPKQSQFPNKKQASSLQYELVSVVEHHGGHSGGHYTVFKKVSRDSKQWYHISDDVVRKVSHDDVTRSKAYMLYYEQAPSI